METILEIEETFQKRLGEIHADFEKDAMVAQVAGDAVRFKQAQRDLARRIDQAMLDRWHKIEAVKYILLFGFFSLLDDLLSEQKRILYDADGRLLRRSDDVLRAIEAGRWPVGGNEELGIKNDE